MSKDLYKKIEELEVKDDFEKINSGIDYSKYTLKEKKNFNFRLVLVPLTMLVILAVILPLTGIFNTPSDESDLPDNSVLGEEIVGEEYKMMLSILSNSQSEDIELPPEISIENLLWYFNYDENNKIIELTAIGYGDFICGYLTDETINKVKNHKDKATEIDDWTISEGIDDLYAFYHLIKIGDYHREEPILMDDELFLYRKNNGPILYENKSKRLVVVWREILLETNDGRQMKVLCNVTGETSGNEYMITQTISQNEINGEKICIGDKFWMRNSDFCSLKRCSRYPLILFEINKEEKIYIQHYIYKSSSVKEKFVRDIEWYDYYSNWLENNSIEKKYISEWPAEVEIWEYLMDYFEGKEVLKVE